MADNVENKIGDLKKQIRQIKSQRSKYISDIYTGLNTSGWFLFSVYFIEATKVLLNGLEKESQTEKALEKNWSPNIYVPLIFLFRHTLELILKYVYISQTKEQEGKEKINTHDLSDIFNKIKKINFASTKNISKYVAKHPSVSTEIAKKKLNSVKELIENLSEKYLFQTDFVLNLSDSKDDLPKFSIVDIQNELFKYPVTNNVRVVFDPTELCVVNSETISSLKSDFSGLEEILNIFCVID